MSSSNSVGRPREFDEPEALVQLMNLFWAKGYEATTLSDMATVTGLQKASLYAAFGNKQAMYLKAIAHYENLFVDGACKSLRSGSDPTTRLEAFLSSPMTAFWDDGDTRGCFLCNASADKAALDEDTAALVRRGYDKIERAVAANIRETQPGTLPAKITMKARLILTTYSGLRIMARSGIDRAVLEDAKIAALEL